MRALTVVPGTPGSAAVHDGTAPPAGTRELLVDGLTVGVCGTAPGGEGAFVPCSFRLADALTGIGHREEAEALFTRLPGPRNDLGLLSEKYGAAAGRQVGDTPQAFSHVGLVDTARHLSGSPAARERGRCSAPAGATASDDEPPRATRRPA